MRLTKGQIALIVIGVLALLTPLWVYMWHLSQNGISGEPEHWGQFGDFIGGIMNPVIGLLTLATTIVIAYYLKKADDKRKDREAKLEYGPHLIIQIERAYIHAITTPEGFLSPVDMLTENIPISKYEYLGRSTIIFPIVNIGLGIAKKIIASVHYDHNEIINVLMEMNKKHPENGIDVHYDAAKDMVLFKGPGHNVGANRVKLLTTTNVTYIVSIRDSNKPSFVKIPPALVSLFLSYIYHSWVYDVADDTKPKFPLFHINVKYQDLEGTEDERKFEVQLLYEGNAASIKSVVDIILTEIK